MKLKSLASEDEYPVRILPVLHTRLQDLLAVAREPLAVGSSFLARD